MPLTHLFLALLFMQTPKPGSVSGVVTNSVTGAPVRKARVTLQSGGNHYAAITDAAGHFAISNVAPESYTAATECQGFQPLRSPGAIRVAEDQRVENVALQLIPLGVITGKVLDENGNPMAQMSVEAAVESFSRTGRKMGTAGLTMTDDRGEYRIFDLPAGRYYVRVFNPSPLSSPNGRLHTEQVETAYTATWFPGVTDATEAAAGTLAPGAELGGIDFRLRKVRVYHIRGKVQAPGSQQRLEGPVAVAPCDGATAVQLWAPILRDGSFDATGIVPGNWCATVNQVIDNSHGFAAHQSVTVTDRDVDNVSLTATATAEIHGQILVDGAPPAKEQHLPIRLEALDIPSRGAGSGGNADGTFTLLNVEPGTYRLLDLNLYGMYLKAVRFNGQEAADGRIQVPPGGGELTLYFATDSGELSGTVQAGGMLVTASSVIAPVNPQGAFLMRGLAPGDYQVLAWETSDRGLLEYAGFRKLFETRAVTVTVHPKGRETVPLNVVTAAEIEAAKARLR